MHGMRMKTLAAGTVLALAAAGCGVGSGTKAAAPTTTNGTPETSTKTTGTGTSTTGTKTTAAIKLPSRPAGQLVVDGYANGSLTQQAYQLYTRQGGNASVTIGSDTSAGSFNSLCTGQADIVDSSTSITKKEQAVCHQNGIVPVQLEVASNAVVLATENETDVGADCLTLAQVRAIFRAGSPVENWQQLGFDDVPLSVAGPSPTDSNFAYFGQFLVDSNNPGSEDFRFDYHNETSEDAIRRFVTGVTTANDSQAELAQGSEAVSLNELSTAQAYLKGWRATYRGAVAAVKAYKASKKTVAAHNSAVLERKALHFIHVYEGQIDDINVSIRGEKAVQRRLLGVLGHLGVFQYGYYGQFEQQLRPLEITSKTNPENCVFPSQATITSGDYPLSREFLLTFSLQKLRSSTTLRQFLISYLKNSSALTNNANTVALPANVLSAEEAWLAGGGTGKLTIPRTPPPINEPGNAVNSMSGTSGGDNDTSGTTVTTSSSGAAVSPTAGAVPSGALVPSGVH